MDTLNLFARDAQTGGDFAGASAESTAYRAALADYVQTYGTHYGALQAAWGGCCRSRGEGQAAG